MIPNMWYAVLDSSQVKAGKPYAFRRLNEDMVFWRDNTGKIVAMRDLCPHRQSKLSPGKIVDGNIQCHFHGFQYDNQGACQLIPANGRNGPKPKVFQCRTYETREEHGFIWVWYGERRDEYPPVPFFDDLDGYAYDTFWVEWNVHYSRAVEGVLDVSHLPFVHANTIGRGGRTLVNGPYTTLENDEMRVWVSNQPDEGLPAMKPTQVPPPDGPPSMIFKSPNVWQLLISDKLRNIQITAPIDEEHTAIYIRMYQSIVTTPILRDVFGKMMSLSNRYVLNEDKEIITTQTPKRGDINAGYFIPGDRPIALYLIRRNELLAEASSPAPTPKAARREPETV